MPPIRASTPLFEPDERAFIEAVVRYAFANPFGPERALAEREALGADHIETGTVWTQRGNGAAPRENLQRIRSRFAPLVERLRERLAAGAAASPAELTLYKEACLFYLYDRHAEQLRPLLTSNPARVDVYGDFAREHARLLGFLGSTPKPLSPAHLFACAFQIRRALHHIASSLVGASRPLAHLRAVVWESIFTYDMRRYLRTMYARLDETSTLIVGPTGTGKERVARAIGLSCHVPFDPVRECLVADHAERFHGITLSALSPTVIESELFGHKRGAFTGAVADKEGWLDRQGVLFLDEIGEIDETIQVKLLRVIQERSFTRVGGMKEEKVTAKILAATNRDLVGGTFRHDLYMRICGDPLRTPSLREILADAPGDRRTLVRHIAEKVAGPDEADTLTDQVEAWLDATLKPDHPWSGNMRELEQYVRRRLVHHSCRPIEMPVEVAAATSDEEEEDELARDLREGNLTTEEVLRRHTTMVLAKTGNARETARRLGVDRRTVMGRVDHAMLARLTKRWGGGAGDGD